jgi:hypothetical protein
MAETIFDAVAGSLESRIGHKVVDLVCSGGTATINCQQTFGHPNVIILDASGTGNFSGSPLFVGYADTTFATATIYVQGTTFSGTLTNVVLTYLVV